MIMPELLVHDVDVFSVPVPTRFPFAYGIARMTQFPHLFVRARMQVNQRMGYGLTAEGLPPKWFTKDPTTRFEDDLEAMHQVIAQAARVATAPTTPAPFFDWWLRLYRAQQGWAEREGVPPLLAHLGTSLMERAALDGFCRLTETPLRRAVHDNTLGLDLGALHVDLASYTPTDLLPEAPPPTLKARHTIGLGDPLEASDLGTDENPDDGLPYVLRAVIRHYGLSFFKIKIRGDLPADMHRLLRLAQIFDEEVDDVCFTLDGNEQFESMAAFRRHWDAYQAEPALRRFFDRLLFVEQPVQRDQALGEAVGKTLRDWPDHPPLIIDESDATLVHLPRALALGYNGTSHKNCKGVIKGLVHACLLAKRRRQHPDQYVILSGEDLCTIGPVALLQDMAVMALLGVSHVERNGHHYIRGLSAFPEAVQRTLMDAHGDLYAKHPNGFATLRLDDGVLPTTSILEAPFGVKPLLDPSTFAS